MGLPSLPKRVKLIAGLISNDVRSFERAGEALAKRFGRVDFESPFIDFTATSYYDEEFGAGLKRKFVSFARLVELDGIASVKTVTNAIERRMSVAGKRTVNIDPGYLDLSKLILFTTKDYSHRMYLARGIYGEVTLSYRNGSFRPLGWTYPDYRTEGYIGVFNAIRKKYREDLDDLH